MILDLPDEVLVRVLAGAGCHGLCAAAASCRRLAALKAQLEARVMFSSALESACDLPSAVAAATRRAKEGLLGACDFALLLLTGFAMHPRGGDARAAEECLAEALGLDVPTVGCRAEGVLAYASGAAREHTERFRGSAGAAVVVLGRMPGVCAVPFAGKSPPKPRGAHNKMPLPLSAVPWPPLQEALAAGLVKCALQRARAERRTARLARWRQLERAPAGEVGRSGGGGAGASGRAPASGSGVDGRSEHADRVLGHLYSAGVISQPASGGGGSGSGGECAEDQMALDGADALGLEGLRVLQRLQGQEAAGATSGGAGSGFGSDDVPTHSGSQGDGGSGTDGADDDSGSGSDSGSQGVGGEGGGSGGGGGGGGALALQPELLLLLAMPTDWGVHVMDSALQWLAAPGHLGPCPVVGGLCAAPAFALDERPPPGFLLVSPGRDMPAPKAAPNHHYVGLALCREPPAPPEAAPGRAAAAAAAAAAGAAPAAERSGGGGGGGADGLRELLEAAALPEPAPGGGERGAAEARCALPPPPPQQQQAFAAALSVQGLRAARDAPVWAVSASYCPEPDGAADAVVITAASAALQPQGRRGGAAPAGRRPRPSWGALPPGLSDLADALGGGDHAVAVWRRPARGALAHAASDEPGAQLVILHLYAIMILPSGVSLVLDALTMGPSGLEAARAALAAGGDGGQLYLQAVAPHSGASEALVRRELPVVISRLPPAFDADGAYVAARAASAARGASAGPLLLLDFACSARGHHLYRRRGVEPALMAAACPQGAAVAGCFVNGEIGPLVLGGGIGSRGGGGGGGGGSGGGEADSEAAETLRQSFTSVFVAVGARPP
ncbi:hypothetical protein Rsub_06587 [Raphidocelis subcapitata]|uniref:F-box domain-containing protein n=1 Tax=Raphidocelis subcapitata TaxID=307507 RepID=A0A2V0P0R1_9CHLO|nr:hypothetical protein Rsub_06587 [Raphidocelis subcapitata]|eukprot:GBF93454.1 hypothetical protein Rsub_06587 [Raphidocelis subcapitata]